MSKTTKILLAVGIIAVTLGGLHYFRDLEKDEDSPVGTGVSVWENGVSDITPSYDLASGNTKEFIDAKRGFTFSYPAEFSASTVSDGNGGEVVLVQFAEKAEGFQIAISPFDDTSLVLTEDVIKKDLPDLEIREVQDLLLGDSGKGLAFLSDNSSFGGKSREVWFVYGGHLYQISTYARLDPLLQAVLGTWKFE